MFGITSRDQPLPHFQGVTYGLFTVIFKEAATTTVKKGANAKGIGALFEMIEFGDYFLCPTFIEIYVHQDI